MAVISDFERGLKLSNHNLTRDLDGVSCSGESGETSVELALCFLRKKLRIDPTEFLLAEPVDDVLGLMGSLSSKSFFWSPASSSSKWGIANVLKSCWGLLDLCFFGMETLLETAGPDSIEDARGLMDSLYFGLSRSSVK